MSHKPTGTLQNLVGLIRDLVALLNFLPAVRGNLADIRVQLTQAVTIASGTITTLSTLANQTSVGGFNAAPQIPALTNIAATLGNIQFMTGTDTLTPVKHIPEFQFLNTADANSAAGSFVVTDATGNGRFALYILNATTHYLYDHYSNMFMPIAASGITGTFGAGACGCHTCDGPTGAAQANTVLDRIVTGLTLFDAGCIGKKVRITSGAHVGLERTVVGVTSITNGSVLHLDSAVPTSAITTGENFQLFTGRFYFFNVGAGMKYFDIATMTWSAALTVPVAFGTDAKLVSTPSSRTWDMPLSTGDVTAATTGTLTSGAKSWATNQWTNSQVYIYEGTGIGQTRTISSNTSTQLTVSANWTVTPDATSKFRIEGNDDFLYLFGNNNVAVYKYTKSTNTWSASLTVSPVRAGAPGAGMSANWIARVNDPIWKNESAIMNGRYIYSFRGAAGNLLDRFDIAVPGWTAITYGGQSETFTAGSAYDQSGSYYYIRKDNTHKFYRYSFPGNCIIPFARNQYTDGAGLVGDKIWTKQIDDNGTDREWLYSIMNTGNVLHRIPIT